MINLFAFFCCHDFYILLKEVEAGVVKLDPSSSSDEDLPAVHFGETKHSMSCTR